MSFDPAHSLFVGYAVESGSVTESEDGVEPAVPPALPGSFAIIGYLNTTPDFARGLNNSYAYAVGSRKGAYQRRGARNPTLSFGLRVANKTILQKAVVAPGQTELPRLCFAIGKPGVWTLAIRDAKINTLNLSNRENPTGEAVEVEARIEALGCYTQEFTTPLNPDTSSLLQGLGEPFFWHDTRQFTIEDSEGEPTDYRQGALMSWSASINNNLERKGLRQNWGDDNAMSITNYSLLEHNEQVTGEISLHGKLPTAYFNAAARAQTWGDIVLGISNAPGFTDPDDGKGFTLTLADAFPTNYSEPGVESNAQLTSTIPYAARGVVIA